ncbi:unnamed protein product [Sympodiomycopsis kandeliae]
MQSVKKRKSTIRPGQGKAKNDRQSKKRRVQEPEEGEEEAQQPTQNHVPQHDQGEASRDDLPRRSLSQSQSPPPVEVPDPIKWTTTDYAYFTRLSERCSMLSSSSNMSLQEMINSLAAHYYQSRGQLTPSVSKTKKRSGRTNLPLSSRGREVLTALQWSRSVLHTVKDDNKADTKEDQEETDSEHQVSADDTDTDDLYQEEEEYRPSHSVGEAEAETPPRKHRKVKSKMKHSNTTKYMHNSMDTSALEAMVIYFEELIKDMISDSR